MTDSTDPEVDEEPFEPLYDNLTDWVEYHFAQTYAWKPGSSARWCASWWDHPEAIVRLNVLWQLWEGARSENDPAASSTAPSTVAASTPMPALCWRVARWALWRAVT